MKNWYLICLSFLLITTIATAGPSSYPVASLKSKSSQLNKKKKHRLHAISSRKHEKNSRIHKKSLKKHTLKHARRSVPHMLFSPRYAAESEPVSAIVFNANTRQVLFQKNPHLSWHPASLTKKMTLYLLFEALSAGEITMDTEFPISCRAASQQPSKLWLKSGSKIKVKDIVLALITKSANDASCAAAEGLAGSVESFAALMNKKAKQLGMKNTAFFNPTGLPDTRHRSTAHDMMLLAFALYNHFPEYFHLFRTKAFSYKGQSHANHNKMLSSYAGMDGMKTGFTNASGFNISTTALRYQENGYPVRLFAVVFGGKNRFIRDRFTAKILDNAFLKLGAYRHTQK